MSYFLQEKKNLKCEKERGKKKNNDVTGEIIDAKRPVMVAITEKKKSNEVLPKRCGRTVFEVFR